MDFYCKFRRSCQSESGFISHTFRFSFLMTSMTSGKKSSRAFSKQCSFLQDSLPAAVLTEVNNIITSKLKGIKRRLSSPAGAYSEMKLLLPALNLATSIASLGSWSRSSLFKAGCKLSVFYMHKEGCLLSYLFVYFNYS